MTVRFGLLGAGRIGKVHATRDHRQSRRAAGGGRGRHARPPPRRSPASTAARCARIDAIAAAADIDAVVICTPTDTHADLIERFARGRQGDLLREADRPRRGPGAGLPEGRRGDRRDADGRLQPPLRPALSRRCARPIDDGAIGTVEMVTITSRDPGAPPVDYITRSGGIFRDMTIHDFDMARLLLGEEPVDGHRRRPRCWSTRRSARPATSTASTSCSTTASGKQAVISNSRRATYGYDQRIEVHGLERHGRGREPAPGLDRDRQRRRAITRPPLLDFFMTRYTEAYAAEIAAFIAGLSGGASARSHRPGRPRRAGAGRGGGPLGGRRAQGQAQRNRRLTRRRADAERMP